MVLSGRDEGEPLPLEKSLRGQRPILNYNATSIPYNNIRISLQMCAGVTKSTFSRDFH